MAIRQKLIWLLLVSLVAGCSATQYHFMVKPVEVTKARDKIMLSAGLQLSPDFCTYVYTSTHQGGKNRFELGPGLCDYSKSIAKEVFSSVAVAESSAFNTTINVIIKPRIINVTVFYRTGVIPARVESVILLEWRITNKNGDIIFVTTIQGDGVDERKYGLADVRYQASMQNALDDLFKKSYREIISSPELKEAAGRLHAISVPE